jgi:hypothetical protein
MTQKRSRQLWRIGPNLERRGMLGKPYTPIRLARTVRRTSRARYEPAQLGFLFFCFLFYFILFSVSFFLFCFLFSFSVVVFPISFLLLLFLRFEK